MPRAKKIATLPAGRQATEHTEKNSGKTVVAASDAVVARKTSTKRGSLTTDVYNLKGKVVGKVYLPKEIFGEPLNKTLIAQAVRVYLANQRRGTASTKTRGEVNFSTRKIYRQKGTGRARHGAVSAPIFVHGGVAFGPKPRDYSLNLSKNMKRKALFSALSLKLKDNQIKILTNLDKIEPKTKAVITLLQSLDLSPEKNKILLVLSDQDTEGLKRASRNIENLIYIPAVQLNTYEVLNSDTLMFMKDAIAKMETTFLRKDN